MMAYMLMAGLALGAAGATLGMTVDHHTQLDHHSGRIAVTYRGDVAIHHKQVGTATGGGRSSTLRCDWSAKMTVARHAIGTSGASMTRHIADTPAIAGTRPGWCTTNRSAISQEVASRAGDMRRHLVTVAEEDHAALRAELDRLHGAERTG
jgi:hypothetical protein